MLSEKQNRALTEVGAGTGMGELLRRYWMPIAAVAELDDRPTKPVRLMGEDLVLYRDKSGTYGLLDRHCSHRRADLCYGFAVDRGMRCHYRGWRSGENGLKAPPHLKLGFEEFDYGFVYRRVMEGYSEANELWAVGRTCLWPNCLFTGAHFEWRVPIDDANTLSVGWFFDRVPNEMEPFTQDRIPSWYAPVKDPVTGRFITTHVMNQDFIAWVGQGTIADRTEEHLGESDRGIIMMRRKMLEQIEVVGAGGEPKAVVRDAEANRSISLPIIGRDRYLKGAPRGQLLREASSTPGPILPEGFVFLAGQPEEIRIAYRRAMGLDDTWPERSSPT